MSPLDPDRHLQSQLAPTVSRGAPRRVLVVHDRYLQRGGEEEVFEAEVALLRRFGHDVETYEVSNEEVARVGVLRTGIRATFSAPAFRDVSELLRSSSFDLVHVHNSFPLISPGVHWAAHLQDVATVQTLHNFRLLCAAGTMTREGAGCTECLGRAVPWPAVRYACYRNSRLASAAVVASQVAHRVAGTWRKRVDAFIALSKAGRNRFVKAGLPASRIHVKPNFVAPAPRPGPGGETFLFAGRLSPEKGVSTLLAAWKGLEDPPRLEIIGDGPLRREVEAFASEHPAVRVLGRVSLAEVVQQMGRARAVIVPSQCEEAFGRVVVESFSRGTPVIASRIGALGELVEDGSTGLLFPVGDVVALRSQVLRLAGDPQTGMRARARKEYERRYTPDANYLLLDRIYECAISRRRDSA